MSAEPIIDLGTCPIVASDAESIERAAEWVARATADAMKVDQRNIIVVER